MQSALDRAERDLEGDSNLAVGHAICRGHQHHFALGVGQGSQGASKVLKHIFADLVTLVPQNPRGCGVDRHGIPAACPSHLALRFMTNHGIQKRRKPRSQAQAPALSVEIEKRLLDGVHGKVVVVGESESDSEGPITVPKIEFLERRTVAAAYGLNELLVSLGLMHSAESVSRRRTKAATSFDRPGVCWAMAAFVYNRANI